MTLPPDLRLPTPDEVFMFRVALVIGLFIGAGVFVVGGWPVVAGAAVVLLVITRPRRRAR